MKVKTVITMTPLEAQTELNLLADKFLNNTDKETTEYVVLRSEIPEKYKGGNIEDSKAFALTYWKIPICHEILEYKHNRLEKNVDYKIVDHCEGIRCVTIRYDV